MRRPSYIQHLSACAQISPTVGSNPASAQTTKDTDHFTTVTLVTLAAVEDAEHFEDLGAVNNRSTTMRISLLAMQQMSICIFMQQMLTPVAAAAGAAQALQLRRSKCHFAAEVCYGGRDKQSCLRGASIILFSANNQQKSA